MVSIERALRRRVCEWGDHHCLGLTVKSTPDKTTTVMFHCGRKRDHSPELYMGARRLQYFDKMTYLEITFSKRLIWTNHIKSRVHNYTCLLNRTKKLSEKNGG